MDDRDFEQLVGWLRADIKSLFGKVDDLQKTLTTQVAKCDLICGAGAERERSRERRGDRWWGFGLRLLAQAVVVVAAALAGIIGALGRCPW